MRARNSILAGLLAAAAAPLAAAAIETAPAADPRPVAPVRTEEPQRAVTLSIGNAQMIRLAKPMTGVFVADPKIADVQVRGAGQLYVFGKAAGTTSIYATDKAGAVVWSTDVRVANNITEVGAMLRQVMPDSGVVATPVGGMVVLSGEVAGPAVIEEAQRIVEAFVGKDVQIINRMKATTPLQVHLQVKIVEVSRSAAKDIGINLLNRDRGKFIFGIGQGNAGTIKTETNALSETGAPQGATLFGINNLPGTTLAAAGRLLGFDILATLQLYENDGLATTLAEPTLTALSGETASFLAGGEIPIPQATGLGAVNVQFKQYGVSLAFTPTVLADGHILLRVRPEVSQISDIGAVRLNNFTIPALTTRRVDTTVDLGSGQSFMIGGLLQNNHNNTVSKAPFLGDLPILGALFRSTGFRRQETELVVVVTPYLVRPVDAGRIALPTDGYRAPSAATRVLEGKQYNGTAGDGPAKPATTPFPTPAHR